MSAVISLCTRIFTRYAVSMFGLSEQDILPADENDLFAADTHENSSDEEAQVVHRHGIFRDIEEGRSNSDEQDKQTVQFELNSKCHTLYFLTTTCGFIASAFSFNVGMVFIFLCPGHWILPCLQVSMGASCGAAQLFIISKLLGKNFSGFRSYQEAALNICFIFLVTQWLMEVMILYIMGETHGPRKGYCKPEFYRYTVIANLIVILAFMVHNVLKCCGRQKRKE